MSNAIRGQIMIAANQPTDAEGRSWIEIIGTAENAENNIKFTLTEDDLAQLVARIGERPDRIPVDYDHSGDLGGSTLAAGWFTGNAKVVRAGETNPYGETQDHTSAWGEVNWTPKALQQIRDGEFRFVSGVVEFQGKDAETGIASKFKDFVAATLTNRPFNKNLSPVLASDLIDSAQIDGLGDRYGNAVANFVLRALAGDNPKMKEAALAVIAADGMPDKQMMPYGDVQYADPGYRDDKQKRYPIDTEEHARAAWSYINQAKNAAFYSADQLAQIKSRIRSALKKFGVDVQASDDNQRSEVELSTLAVSLGLPEDADEATVLAKVEEHKQAAAAATNDDEEGNVAKTTDYIKSLGLDENADQSMKVAAALNDKDEKILALTQQLADANAKVAEADALKNDIEELKAKDRQRDIERLLERAVSDGRVFPAEKETYMEVFANDVAGLRKVLATRPAGFTGSTRPKGVGSNDLERFVDDPEVTEYAKQNIKGDYEADPHSTKVHLQALRILKEQGKDETDVDAYILACEKAERELAAA